MSTPWKDWREWEEVRHGLLEGSPTECEQALELVEVWKARSLLPLAVESSSVIVSLFVADKVLPTQPGGAVARLQEISKRHSWCLALVRFINGFADIGQKGHSARPVLHLIRQLGISEHLVSLRHEGTHGALPSLPALRAACGYALDWLISSYWEPTRQHIERLGTTFRELIRRYARSFDRTSDAATSKRQKTLGHLIQRLSSPMPLQLFCECLLPLLVPGAPPPSFVQRPLATQTDTQTDADSHYYESLIDGFSSRSSVEKCWKSCVDALAAGVGPSLGYALVLALAPFASTDAGAAWINFLFESSALTLEHLDYLPHEPLRAAAQKSPASPVAAMLLQRHGAPQMSSAPVDLDQAEALVVRLRAEKRSRHCNVFTPAGTSLSLEPRTLDIAPLLMPLVVESEFEEHNNVGVSDDSDERQIEGADESQQAQRLRKKRLRWL